MSARNPRHLSRLTKPSTASPRSPILRPPFIAFPGGGLNTQTSTSTQAVTGDVGTVGTVGTVLPVPGIHMEPCRIPTSVGPWKRGAVEAWSAGHSSAWNSEGEGQPGTASPQSPGSFSLPSSADVRSNRSAQFPAQTWNPAGLAGTGPRAPPQALAKNQHHSNKRAMDAPNFPQLPRPHMDFPSSWRWLRLHQPMGPCHLVDPTGWYHGMAMAASGGLRVFLWKVSKIERRKGGSGVKMEIMGQ